MKKILNIVIALQWFLAINIFANETPCIAPTYCDPNIKYLHKFCKNENGNNTIVNICTNNPYNEAYPPLKAKGRMCINFIYPAECEQVNIKFKKGNTTISKLVFDAKKYWQTIVDQTKDAWVCFCGMENQECVCTVDLKFSKLDKDFKERKTGKLYLKSPALVNGILSSIDYSDCSIDCKKYKPTIYINNTKFFTKGVGKNDRENFFYMDEVLGEDADFLAERLANGYTIYNIRHIIEHEIGHLYGFPNYVDIEDYENCNFDENKMYGMGGGNTRYQPFYNDDACQFRRLYCPESSVGDYNKAIDLSNNPNPVNNETVIRYCVGAGAEVAYFELFNQLGISIETINLGAVSGCKYLHFDATNLQSGFYYYTIRKGGEIKTGKMVVMH